MDYRRKVIPDVVDITIKKDVFIKEFKQMLDEISRYQSDTDIKIIQVENDKN